MATPSEFELSLSAPESPEQVGRNFRGVQAWSKTLPFPRIHVVPDLVEGMHLEIMDDEVTFDLYPPDSDGFWAGEQGIFIIDLAVHYRVTDLSPGTTAFSINTLNTFALLEGLIGLNLVAPGYGSYVQTFKGIQQFAYEDRAFQPQLVVGSTGGLGVDLSTISTLVTFFPQGITNTLTRQTMNKGASV